MPNFTTNVTKRARTELWEQYQSSEQSSDEDELTKEMVDEIIKDNLGKMQ